MFVGMGIGNTPFVSVLRFLKSRIEAEMRGEIGEALRVRRRRVLLDQFFFSSPVTMWMLTRDNFFFLFPRYELCILWRFVRMKGHCCGFPMSCIVLHPFLRVF